MHRIQKLARLWCQRFLEWRDLEGSYLYMYRDILSVQGLWPARVRSRSGALGRAYRYCNPRLVLTALLLMTCVVLPCGAWTARAQPLPELLEPLLFMFLTALATTNAVSLMLLGDRFQTVLDAWLEVRECARSLPLRSARIAGRVRRQDDAILGFAFASIAGTVAMCFGMLPLLLAKRALMGRGWYPFDEHATPYFEFTLITWVSCLMSSTAFCVPAFALLATILSHAHSQLALLNVNMRALGEAVSPDPQFHLEVNCRPVTVGQSMAGQSRIDNSTAEQSTNDQSKVFQRRAETHRQLGACVRHHQAINRLVAAFEAAFDPIVTQYHVACAAPAGLAVLTLQEAERDMALATPVLVILVMFTSLAVISHLGSGITTESAQVRESAYACAWLRESDAFRRSLRIVLSRSNQPLVVVVTGFIPLSLPTFLAVCKMTFELYNFMGQVKTVDLEAFS